MKHDAELNRKAGELVAHFDAFARRFAAREKPPCRGGAFPTLRELRVLAAVGEKPAWTAGELARRMMLSVSGLTSALDGLVAKRLVRRERSDEDRRVVWVSLTPEGRRWRERFRRRRFQRAREMLSALDEAEQRTFIGLMRKIGQGGGDPEVGSSSGRGGDGHCRRRTGPRG